MKKNKYYSPETTVYQVDAQQMMALSKMPGTASNEYDVLVNQVEFTDIWGN